MCFDHDSRPPITPIAGGATDARDLTLQSADGTRFRRLRGARDAADRRRHGRPAGRARASHVLQGAGAPLRGGRRRLDRHRLLRPHGQDRRPERRVRVPAARRPDARRPRSRRTSRPRWRYLRSKEGGQVRALFSVGFCFGGALSFLQAASGLGYAGVIGFYGWPLGLPRWPDRPKPIDAVSRFRAPVLAIYGGADPGIPPSAIADFDQALTRAGVQHDVRHVRRRTAQLLRPEADRVRRRVRRRVEEGAGVRQAGTRRPEAAPARARAPGAGRAVRLEPGTTSAARISSCSTSSKTGFSITSPAPAAMTSRSPATTWSTDPHTDTSAASCGRP